MKIHSEHQDRLRGLFSTRRFHEALDYLLGLKSAYQQDKMIFKAPYYLDLARCFSAVGDYKNADQYFDLAFGTFGNYFFARIVEAESFLQRGQFTQARDNLVALADNVEFSGRISRIVHFHQVAGSFFKLTGDYAQAKACYEAGAALTTRPGTIHNDLKYVSHILSCENPNPVAGLVEYCKLLRKRDRENQENGHSSSLTLTFLTNRIKSPLSSFEEMTCHSILSKCYMDVGNTAQARTHVEKARAIDSGNLDVILSDILCNLAERDVPQARLKFNAYSSPLMQTPKKTIALAQAFLSAGDHETGALLANAVLHNEHSPGAALKCACSILAVVYGGKRIPA